MNTLSYFEAWLGANVLLVILWLLVFPGRVSPTQQLVRQRGHDSCLSMKWLLETVLIQLRKI